jgi:hypothetical protein
MAKRFTVNYAQGLSTYLDHKRIQWKATRTGKIQIIDVTDPAIIWNIAIQFSNFQQNFLNA